MLTVLTGMGSFVCSIPTPSFPFSSLPSSCLKAICGQPCVFVKSELGASSPSLPLCERVPLECVSVYPSGRSVLGVLSSLW